MKILSLAIWSSLVYFIVACDKGFAKEAKNKHSFIFEFHHFYEIPWGYLNDDNIIWYFNPVVNSLPAKQKKVDDFNKKGNIDIKNS